MTKSPNGSMFAFRLIAAILGVTALLITTAGLVWSASTKTAQSETTKLRVDIIEPKVEALTKHQIESEISLLYIEKAVEDLDGRLDGIEGTQSEILEAVRKIAPE